jgi:hypothetical protein
MFVNNCLDHMNKALILEMLIDSVLVLQCRVGRNTSQSHLCLRTDETIPCLPEILSRKSQQKWKQFGKSLLQHLGKEDTREGQGKELSTSARKVLCIYSWCMLTICILSFE